MGLDCLEPNQTQDRRRFGVRSQPTGARIRRTQIFPPGRPHWTIRSLEKQILSGDQAREQWAARVPASSGVCNGGVVSDSLGLTSHKSSCNCTGCGMLRAGVCINCAEKIAGLILESDPRELAVDLCLPRGDRTVLLHAAG